MFFLPNILKATKNKFIKQQIFFYKFMSEQIEDKINSMEERTWGELPMVQSNTNYNLKYTELSQITNLTNESSIILRARV